MGVIGRRDECAVLEQLVEDVRAGRSRTLVIHGDPGVGKSALLDFLAERAVDCSVLRVSGIESEMELAFAGLHQLCGAMLAELDNVPAPQRDALRTVFGITDGPAPDRFLIALGVLSLFAEVATRQPLICLIDDQQWLDQASAQVLAFVARRLLAESVGLVFAARTPNRDLAGLPQLMLQGLPDEEARALLETALNAPLDARVRDQILAETRGNPLALLELPRGRTAEQLAGGFGLPSAPDLSGTIEEGFRQRIVDLPEDARTLLLLVAAAEPRGDPGLVWAAAARLGIGADAASAAVDAGVAEFGTRIRFRHPLARSAAYHCGSPGRRQQAHRALAEVTDRSAEPDRRAWHLAHAAAAPDQDVADELVRCAGRAQACGGMAAAAAFLARATALTLDPVQRAERALEAAAVQVEAGAFDAAQELVALTEAGPLTDMQRARVELVRAKLAFVTNRGNDAPPLLLKAAEQLAPIDAVLSRETYLEALGASTLAAGLAAGCSVRDVACAARMSAPPAGEELWDLLLDGFAASFADDYVAGLPILRRAVEVARADTGSGETRRWLWLAGNAALHIWDAESWDRLSARHLALARGAGALSELPLAITTRAVFLAFAGELAAAQSLVQELQTVQEAIGDHLAWYAALTQAAFRGDRSATEQLEPTVRSDVESRGEGLGLTVLDRVAAVLHNGLGNYARAMTAAQRGAGRPADFGVSTWCLVELIEAAMRNSAPDVAAEALARLTAITDASGTDWALGVAARCRALVGGAAAEELFREAVERLGRTPMRAELARAHLLYGEWLRRERRRVDARDQLRIAHDMLDAMGMAAFAERARRELAATGETARKRTVALDGQQLTAQEAQVARLARDGLSNPEIGARLFISARTAQYHLRKVFAKLEISSRSQLDRVLPVDLPVPR